MWASLHTKTMADFVSCRMVLLVASLTPQRMESLARLRRP